MSKIKLRVGDTVEVIAGKDKSKSGKLLRIDRKKMRVVVEGVSMIKKTQKPRQEGEQGSIIEIEAPIAISNVLLKCGKCARGVRIGIKVEGEKKTRVCKKCGEAI
ncbi:50S ribosomal protein L24 [Entomospira entomophila]|uniref:Large ribosomal subunit protein uL24 n=1 Tax=Entomospira entomophila TaxID=2719988 RepID=A0A968KR05_9SPIO|nr:50S ribosomal protein L24 [Entomospira entomophilus]NIZ40243.1 50S ribosomal protein L24 [Entomospira entomophilus]WDI35802.1 50S ribosomal protein L24 [Entomospira entomophilus]